MDCKSKDINLEDLASRDHDLESQIFFCFMENQEEIWKDVLGFEGYYQVSSLGRLLAKDRYVTSKDGKVRFFEQRIRKTSLTINGYLFTIISKNGTNHKVLIHRIVATAFIENSENRPFVNHINGNKTDNRAENLEWCTSKENMAHAVKNGLCRSGQDSHFSKLTLIQVRQIRKLLKDGHSVSSVAKIIGNITPMSIYYIKNNKTWINQS